MSYYEWDHNIKDKGLIEVPLEDYKELHKEKADYVNGPLKEAMVKGNCGWDNLTYKLMSYPDNKGFDEYIVLSNKGSNRWVIVSGESCAGIFCALANNIW